MIPAVPVLRSSVSFYWLILGIFAVGAEIFMVAPILPSLAATLWTSVLAHCPPGAFDLAGSARVTASMLQSAAVRRTSRYLSTPQDAAN